jgi:thioredoxin-like negative regulator of GroEL
MGDKIRDLGGNEFDETINETDKLVIVQFYTTTCPNCKAVAPVYSKLSSEHDLDAVFAQLNVENNAAIASRYGVMGVPTFKFFCKGNPIGELVGAINATLLRNTIKDLIRHRNECYSKSTKIAYEIDGYS